MTKYYIRVYWTDKISPTIFEGVDRYLMERDTWFTMKWDNIGSTTFLNVSTVGRIVVEEVEEDADHE